MPIRTRLAGAFALAALALFAVSALLFERSFRSGVKSALDPGLRTQWESLSRTLRAGGDLELSEEASVATADLVAQVLDERGQVLDSTREAGSRALVDAASREQSRDRSVHEEVRVGDEREPYRVLVRPISTSEGERFVLVGESLEAAESAVERVRTALWFGGALVLVVAGAGAWFLAGAVLRPVDRMRRKAIEISERAPGSRLPVPSSRDELAALGTTINELLDRLQHALEVQRAFVADASHELRTPITVLRTELELATRRARTPEELRATVLAAKDEADRLARLIDALLFLARSDQERTGVVRDAQMLAPILQDAANVFERAAGTRDISIDVEVDPTARARVDGDLLRRAVENLMENAIRHTHDGSRVTVRARLDHEGVLIEVLDQGDGFPSEFLPHAFERFRRADGARARDDDGSGIGLGLAIVRAIAVAHQGSVVAANRADGGAMVTMRLPSPM